MLRLRVQSPARVWTHSGRRALGSSVRDPVTKGVVTPSPVVPDSIVRPQPAPAVRRHVHPLSDRELSAVRRASGIVREVLELCGDWVKEGVSTREVDDKIHEAIVSRGAYPSPLLYMGFPKSSCTSVNEIVCHGIPDDRALCDGDIVNVDVSCYIDGHHGDASRMFLVGAVDDAGRKLVETTKRCLDESIAACGPGVDITKIGEVCATIAEESSYGIVRDYCGHGIGQDFHMLPYIFHHHNQIHDIMETGWTFTIEPMLTEDGTSALRVWDDKWTVALASGARSAQYEHTIVITDNGAEILT